MHPCKLKLLHQKQNKKINLNVSDASTEDMDEVPTTSPLIKQSKKILKHGFATQEPYASTIPQPTRTNAINWLLHFATHTQISDASSMLAVRILDAYTAIRSTPCLKIAIIATLVIACKLVESPFAVSHMLFLCEVEEEISSSSVFAIEKEILTALSYKAMLPTELDFSCAYATIVNCPALMGSLAYKCKLHAHSAVISGMLPSLVAACNVFEHFPESSMILSMSRCSKSQVMDACRVINSEMAKLGF